MLEILEESPPIFIILIVFSVFLRQYLRIIYPDSRFFEFVSSYIKWYNKVINLIDNHLSVLKIGLFKNFLGIFGFSFGCCFLFLLELLVMIWQFVLIILFLSPLFLFFLFLFLRFILKLIQNTFALYFLNLYKFISLFMPLLQYLIVPPYPEHFIMLTLSNFF